MYNVNKTLINTLVLLVSILTLSACDGENVDSKSFPDNIANTHWRANCVEINPGRFTQIQIAFSTQSIAIRENLYDDKNCATLRRFGRRKTSGSYRSQGMTDSGLFHAVNFSMSAAADRSHEPYIPLARDIYKIEAGLLFLGDPTAMVKGRPIITKQLSCCTYADNNIKSVFDGSFSQASINTDSLSNSIVDPTAIELEGSWVSECDNGFIQQLTFNAGRVTVEKSYFKDVDCTVFDVKSRTDGAFRIEETILSSNGLDISPLNIQYDSSHDPESELSAETHIYVSDRTLFLGIANSIDFNAPYYLKNQGH